MFALLVYVCVTYKNMSISFDIVSNPSYYHVVNPKPKFRYEKNTKNKDYNFPFKGLFSTRIMERIVI